MFTIEDDDPKPMFGAESDEEEVENESGASVVAYTVVEGEADEDEEEIEDDDDEDEQSTENAPALYPGLQLPPKYRSSSGTSLPEQHYSSASESDGDQSEDYNSLFSDSKFARPDDDGQDYYSTTEFQRKVARQNIQLRKSLADKLVDITRETGNTFTENIAPSVAESIIIAQDVSQNIKHANADLAVLADILGELKPFPTSMFV